MNAILFGLFPCHKVEGEPRLDRRSFVPEGLMGAGVRDFPVFRLWLHAGLSSHALRALAGLKPR